MKKKLSFGIADGNLPLGKVCSRVWGKSIGVFGAKKIFLSGKVEFYGRDLAQPNTLPDSSGCKATGKVATLKIDLARSGRPCHKSQSLSPMPVDAGNQFVGFTTVIYKRGLKSAWCRPRCWRRSMRPSAARTKAGSPHSFFMRKCGSFFAARNQKHVTNIIVL